MNKSLLAVLFFVAIAFAEVESSESSESVKTIDSSDYIQKLADYKYGWLRDVIKDMKKKIESESPELKEKEIRALAKVYAAEHLMNGGDHQGYLLHLFFP